MKWIALLIVLPAFAGPASAGKFHHPEAPFVPVHNCTCRFNGEDVGLGERRCLKTPDGPRSALCVMEQNVTSWRIVSEPCPQASFSPRSGSAPISRRAAPG